MEKYQILSAITTSGKLPFKFYRLFVKPAMDFSASFLALLLLAPFLLIISLALAIHLKKSPFYVQKRIGKKERAFGLLKFRTFKVEDEWKSVTSFCRFLRQSSIDELPQLVNIFIGDMSFIGPRPLLVAYLPFYSQNERIRHLVKPGLSGWSQLRFGNSEDWESRLQADVEYVVRQSFLFDLTLLMKTMTTVLEIRKKSERDVRITPLDKFRSK